MAESIESSSSVLSPDLLEELEALNAIYEKDITVDTSNDDVVKLKFSLSNKIYITFYINSDYPTVGPTIKSNVNQITKTVQSEIQHCLGTPMLYTLISKSMDVYTDLPNDTLDIVVKKTKDGNRDETVDGDEKVSIHKKNKKQDTTKKRSQPEETDTTKKKSMRTSIDVINRILWDESLPTNQFIVGYLDRFIGIVEKPFSSFSWEDIASVDYNVLAIPKHRIQYFKYKQTKIWDKNERFDYVFNSTGHTKTLNDILNEDTNYLGNNDETKDGGVAVGDKKYLLGNANKNNDGITVVNDGDGGEGEGVKYNDRNRPNHFLCLPITNEEVKRNLLQVQSHILTCDERLDAGMINQSCYHITLFMFRLENEKDQEKARHVLQELQEILVCMLPSNGIFLKVHGVDDFRRLVVCATVEFHKTFHKFVDIAKLTLKNTGIRLVGNYDPYTPHVTLLKLRRPMVKQLDMNQISPFLYKDFEDLEFGQQEINSLKICSTDQKRGEDGFYETIGTIPNTILCISDQLANLISEFITVLMSQGLILEDVGDEYIATLFSKENEIIESMLNNLEKDIRTFNLKLKKSVLILRGLPGSGKSYFVQNLHENTTTDTKMTVCSADGYFEEKFEEYKFSGEDIAAAHKFCRKQFIQGIKDHSDLIIIDNSHTQCWEYQIYQRIATLCGYTYHILEIPCEDVKKRKLYQKRCLHKVSGHIHEEMYKRWEVDLNSVNITADRMLTVEDIIKGNFKQQQNLEHLTILYSALFLDEESKSLLLSTFPPSHSIISANHMTICHSPSHAEIQSLPIGLKCRVKVTGYINNTRIQSVAVKEINSKLCSQELPHVTISRNETTPAKDAQKWLADELQWRPLKEIVLTGIIGVQIATGKTTSIACTDPSQLSTCSTVAEEQNDLPPENQRKIKTNKQNKQQQKKKQQKTTKTNVTSDDVEMYFGPCLIKSLYIFDFDGTLFHTPGPVQGRNDYKNLTGINWPYSGWLGQVGSLQYPLQVPPGPTFKDYFEYFDRACSMSILLTGRIERVREGVESITIANQMNFARKQLKPEGNRNENRQRNRGGHNVYSYKKDYVASLLVEFPSVTELYFWDDRPDNIKSIRTLQNQFPHVKIHLRNVQEENPNIYNLKPEDLLRRMGRQPSTLYKQAVIESIGFINKAWMEVLSTSCDQTHNIKVFGSYVLNRKSDVDLCILAPKQKNNSSYISALGEKLKCYGVQYIHTAANIRCPRIRVKFEFLQSPPVECDITVAAVLENASSLVTDDMKELYKNTDSINKNALEGLVFLEETVKPVEAKISLDDFGMIVDLVCITLERNQLKGNVFHCIRTFHIVHMLTRFIDTCTLDVLPREGITTVKTLEKLFLTFLRFLSNVGAKEWQQLFKSFVPDTYIEPLITYFKQCTFTDSTIGSILFTAPKSTAQSHTIQLKLEGKDEVELWKSMVLTEAFLGGCIRGLIDQGINVKPGYILKDIICFSTDHIERTRKLLELFVINLQREIHDSVEVKVLYG